MKKQHQLYDLFIFYQRTRFSINPGNQRVFSISTIINVLLALSASFEYLCYGSTAIRNISISNKYSSVRGSRRQINSSFTNFAFMRKLPSFTKFAFMSACINCNGDISLHAWLKIANQNGQ